MATRKIRVRGKHGLYTRTIKVAQKSPKAGAYLRAVAHGASQGVGTGAGFVAGGRLGGVLVGGDKAIISGMIGGAVSGRLAGHHAFLRSRMGQQHRQDWRKASDWGRVGLTAARSVGNVAGTAAAATAGFKILVRWNKTG